MESHRAGAGIHTPSLARPTVALYRLERGSVLDQHCSKLRGIGHDTVLGRTHLGAVGYCSPAGNREFALVTLIHRLQHIRP